MNNEIMVGGTELQETPVEIVIKKIRGKISISIGDYLFQNVVALEVGEIVITLSNGTKINLNSRRAFREAFVSRTTMRQASMMIAADREAGRAVNQ